MKLHNVLIRPTDLFEEILRRKLISGGGGSVLQTVTGISPLTLLNVARRGIKSLTQFGKCEQTGTPTPSVPVDIKCNNGALKTYPPRGTSSQASTPSPSSPVPIVDTEANGMVLRSLSDRQDTYSSAAGTITRRVGVIVLDGTEDWNWDGATHTLSVPDIINADNRKIAMRCTHYPIEANGTAYTNVPPNTMYGLSNRRIGLKNDTMDSAQFKSFLAQQYANGTPVIAYYPLKEAIAEVWSGGAWYTQSEYAEVLTVSAQGETQTASVENLLEVGDFEDTQNIISGEVARKVGVRVLDGTEEWTTDTYGGNRRFVTRNFAKEQLSTVVCTHYSSTIEDGARTSPNNAYVAATGALAIYIASTQSIDTAEDWKAYLAQQYANGTPVIVVYPLAEPTTEQVTAQHLTARDTATVTAVTENISDISLEVQYWQKAE